MPCCTSVRGFCSGHSPPWWSRAEDRSSKGACSSSRFLRSSPPPCWPSATGTGRSRGGDGGRRLQLFFIFPASFHEPRSVSLAVCHEKRARERPPSLSPSSRRQGGYEPPTSISSRSRRAC